VVEATTALALSVAPATVTVGHEQAARVTVRVTHAGNAPTPTGNVVVHAGTATVCTIKLSGGAGSCALGASQLKAGSWPLVARYLGDSSNKGATSAPATVTVAG
jgi:hypothetical protein